MPVFGTQSSINAGGYGFLGSTERTIQSTISPRNLTEGTQITVTVTTDGYEDGTYYYTVRGNLGTITASDFTDNSLTGTFTITNDSGSFTKTVAADGVVEEGEGFVIDIRETSHTSDVIETTQSVYIQGSTSSGVGGVDDGQGGSTFHDFGSDGNLIFDADTSTSYTYTAATDVRLKAYIWGQGGGRPEGGQGGYSYGIFNLTQGDALHVRLNYGGGSAGPGQGSGASSAGAGGGLAGIFSSATINQSNARLIAGGGGGGSSPVGGSSASPGGPGGGPSGSGGTNAGSSQINSTGGGGGSQSSGGSAGTANSSFTKSTTSYNSSSRTEAGLLHERSGGVNTTFDISSGSQATCVHQNTFEYIWTLNESYINNTYTVSASNASSHQDYQANGTYIAAGFYAVVDNKTNNSFRVRWYRNDTNTQVNVKYHTIVCTGGRNETTSTTIPVSANGSGGGALQGGSGGNASTGFGANNAAGGGGGGAGYYGGGGGAGGNDYGDTTRASSGGGGGSGYVHSSVINGFTGGFASGQNHPDRGNAGEAGQNAKVVFESITSFAYVSTSGNNETYTVNVPSAATSMTAKVWGAGGSETGEPSGSQSGGSGGHVEGTISVTAGSTVDVYVGGTSSGSVTGGQEGSGAGLGGALSAVKYGSNLLLAGGGGGAGQNGNGGGGGANGAGLDGTGSRKGTGAGVAVTSSDLNYNANRSGTGGLTENPACINNISGWYTRTGGTQTDPFEDIRTLVIKWDGATIGSFTDKEIITIGNNRGVIKNGYFYIPSSKAGNSAYGWCTDDSCGTCSSPNGDMCNSFDVIRYSIPNGAGPGQGGSSNDRPGGSGGAWNDGDNIKDGGTSGGSGVGTGGRGGGGGAGFFGGGGGGGDSSGSNGAGGGGGSGTISGSWTSTVSQQGQTGTGGGRSAVDNTDADYITGYGGSGQGGLVILIFE